jgi:hypothetical protein
MRKWEMKTLLLTGNSHEIQTTLSEQGEAGWELVAVQGSVGYFKRPKEQEAPRPENLRK